MHENEFATIAVDCCYRVHNELGPGLLESAYEMALAYEIGGRGLKTEAQLALPVVYKDAVFDAGYRLDLLIEQKLILELKSVETVLPLHKKQLLTYLRLADKRLGLLVNFNVPLIRDGIFRIANNLQ